MKFPRTIRLDSSDREVFSRAARSGEWAVPGTFAFTEVAPESLTGKDQLAFKSGWLGTASFGRATVVQVAHISEEQFDAVTAALAAHFVDAWGAPDMAEALHAARAEVADATGLADHKAGTLLAIERAFTADGIRERVRVIEPREKNKDMHARIWTVAEDGEGDG